MTLMRSDRQVALRDLHLAMQESADLYQCTAEFLQDSAASKICNTLANERLRLAEQLEQEIRAEGELPSEPDRDKEAIEELQQRLETLFTEDQVAGVMGHRLEAERGMQAFLHNEDLSVLEEESSSLLAECRGAVDGAINRLVEFLGEP
ncbi:hypothetical protein [Microbulbifer sp. YPW1]|uniref:hypothetical protein n=1 Tax=Microbulbifer sp. YPW1 TaxID=2745199 RepID=UPI001597D53E|nr:hypothetical protein [Microbulbifer sp. YPW1]QKX18050.1 hypothetical protein HUW35_14355 [Microbulbifer sp. YPW1]